MSAQAKDLIEIPRDMAITHADYFRLLPLAAEGRPLKTSVAHALLKCGQGRNLAIHLAPQGERRIGPTFRIPTTLVTYRFGGFSAEEAAAFLTRFEMFYQKGGG